MGDDPTVRGVPGKLVARRALDQHGYIDARRAKRFPWPFSAGSRPLVPDDLHLFAHTGPVDCYRREGQKIAHGADARFFVQWIQA